jgi:hypothetical protein
VDVPGFMHRYQQAIAVHLEADSRSRCAFTLEPCAPIFRNLQGAQGAFDVQVQRSLDVSVSARRWD